MSSAATTAPINRLWATDRLYHLLALSFARRWSTVPVSYPQSVADHTFRVMAIIAAAVEMIQQPAVYRLDALLKWAMIHDVEEAFTGDIPGCAGHKLTSAQQFKRDAAVILAGRAEVPYLSEAELTLLKFADLLDALDWVRRFAPAHKCTVCGHLIMFEIRQKLAHLIHGVADPSVRSCFATIHDRVIDL